MTLMNLRFRFAVGVGTILAAGLGVVACGGDDTSVGEPSDSGTDGTVVTADGGLDGSSDATVDGSRSDGGDASSDGGPTAEDAGDGGDAGDAGDGAVSETAQLQTFQNELATVYCTKYAAGCAKADAGTVNIASCVEQISRGDTPVFQGSTNGFSDVKATSRGNTTLNATYAHLCLSEIGAIDYANVVAGPYKTANHDCFSVVQGVLAAGAGCFESIECGSGLYCKKGAYDGGAPDAGDGGDAGPVPTGACSALELTLTDCTAYPAGDSCSYLGIPGGAFCDYDVLDINDPRNPYCQITLQADGQLCFHDADCVSGLCDPHTTVCVEQTSNYVLPDLCGTYK